jgi:hypothetical protein
MVSGQLQLCVNPSIPSVLHPFHPLQLAVLEALSLSIGESLKNLDKTLSGNGQMRFDEAIKLF